MKSKPTSSSRKGNSGSMVKGFGKLGVDKNTSASIRKIENGFLVTENWTKGKGRNQQWGSREYFSATNPVANVRSSAIKFGKK